MVDTTQNNESYVCITHQKFLPCDDGDFHLISNWVVDVKQVINLINKEQREKPHTQII